jgi:hypothetical protein
LSPRLLVASSQRLNWPLTGAGYNLLVPVVAVDEKERTMSSEEQELSAAVPAETTEAPEAPEEEPTETAPVEVVEEDADDDDDDDADDDDADDDDADDDDADDDDDAPADEEAA